jgi:histidine triad (HIT) family protein
MKSKQGLVPYNMAATETPPDTTIYERIYRGELPAYRLFMGHGIAAFLDIHPATPGHTLVVPQEPVENYFDLPEHRADQLNRVARYMGKRIEHELTAPDNRRPLRAVQHIIGNGVPHAHIHVLGSYDREDTKNLWDPARLIRDPDYDLTGIQRQLMVPARDAVELTRALEAIGPAE